MTLNEGGVFFLIDQNDQDLLDHLSVSSDTVSVIGWSAIVVGIIEALVASAIGRAATSRAGWPGSSRRSPSPFVVLYILFGERGSREFFSGAR